MTRLVIVSTGGTIATSADEAGVLRPSRSGADLAALLSAGVAENVEVVDLLAVDSSALTPADWLRIGEAVDHAASNSDGVVVTHGTDTMEETALWLDLTYGGDAPVVLTGAALPADAPDADGPRNLLDALAVAADPRARGLGALISFGGVVRAPLGTTKVGGTQVFGGAPAVGAVSQGSVTLIGPKDRPLLGAMTAAPRVDIAAAYPGADDAALRAFVDAGARGLVLDAMGSGNAGAAVIDAVRQATAAGVAVAVTTRVPNGHAAAVYGLGYDLVAAGAVMVPRLRASQARVLLMAALGTGSAFDQVVARWG
ncbi:MAG: asparaginase [Mycobacterium sp.]|jgi:L-asparaginase|nr:asparaginase [Mycobacterium sp.]